MIADVDHPTVGTLRLPAPPIGLSVDPPTIRRAPPLLGEHTAEVLGELGWKADAIAALAARGAARLSARVEEAAR
jgi:crotonobetainyl-CoA:carnitine CoA-transferase CaiB-like acyl-CoA transferase